MSSDLSESVWREIEKTAGMTADRKPYILLAQLRNILRRSRRSLPQNSLLHALIDEARDKAGETLAGWSHDEVYEFLLGEWSGWEITEAYGQRRKRPMKRSSRLSKLEFSEFLEFIVRFFGEHGIVLELSGDVAA